MKIEKTYYHNECVNQIYHLISDGKKRITLLMPTGSGRLFICLLIADLLSKDDHKAVIISDEKKIALQVQEVIWDNCENKIESITIDRFLRDQTSADLIILYCLKASSRLRMQKYADEHFKTIFLSTGQPLYSDEPMRESSLDYYFNRIQYDPANEKAALGELALLYKKLGDIKPLIYYSKSIIDIRDTITADTGEIRAVSVQLIYDQLQMTDELMELSKDPALTGDSDLFQLFQKLRRKLRYCEQLLISCGIPENIINNEFNEIERLRDRLKAQFFNLDGTLNEAVVSEFQNVIAERIFHISKRVLTLETIERYQDLIIEKLTKEVWENKLCKESKDYLITAKMTFESMKKMEGKEVFDYGGVCLLVTKVLDNELARRMYSSYVMYLTLKYPAPDHLKEWPGSMLERNKKKVLLEKNFTLGTVPYVAGLDKDGKIINLDDNKCFLEYAIKELYKSDFSAYEVEQKIRNLVSYTDKVRVDYRNPCAHRNAIDYVTAEECMDYMLDVYVKLREILEDMKW